MSMREVTMTIWQVMDALSEPNKKRTEFHLGRHPTAKECIAFYIKHQMGIDITH